MSCGLCLGRVRQRAEIPKISWEVPRGGGGRREQRCSSARVVPERDSPRRPRESMFATQTKVPVQIISAYSFATAYWICFFQSESPGYSTLRRPRICLQCRIIAECVPRPPKHFPSQLLQLDPPILSRLPPGFCTVPDPARFMCVSSLCGCADQPPKTAGREPGTRLCHHRGALPRRSACSRP